MNLRFGRRRSGWKRKFQITTLTTTLTIISSREFGILAWPFASNYDLSRDRTFTWLEVQSIKNSHRLFRSQTPWCHRLCERKTGGPRESGDISVDEDSRIDIRG